MVRSSVSIGVFSVSCCFSTFVEMIGFVFAFHFALPFKEVFLAWCELLVVLFF